MTLTKSSRSHSIIISSKRLKNCLYSPSDKITSALCYSNDKDCHHLMIVDNLAAIGLYVSVSGLFGATK